MEKVSCLLYLSREWVEHINLTHPFQLSCSTRDQRSRRQNQHAKKKLLLFYRCRYPRIADLNPFDVFHFDVGCLMFALRLVKCETTSLLLNWYTFFCSLTVPFSIFGQKKLIFFCKKSLHDVFVFFFVLFCHYRKLMIFFTPRFLWFFIIFGAFCFVILVLICCVTCPQWNVICCSANIKQTIEIREKKSYSCVTMAHLFFTFEVRWRYKVELSESNP